MYIGIDLPLFLLWCCPPRLGGKNNKNTNQPQVHMHPSILNPSPTSPSTPSLWVVPGHQLWVPCFMHQTCSPGNFCVYHSCHCTMEIVCLSEESWYDFTLQSPFSGYTAWPTQCTWIWAKVGRYWGIGMPGVLQSMGLWRIGHNNWIINYTWHYDGRWRSKSVRMY